MMIRLHLFVLAAAASAFSPHASLRARSPRASTSCEALSSRRDLLSRGAAATVALGGCAARARAADSAEADAKAAAEKARQEAMKARIAASKTNYRKADALLEQRKGGVDYSCVARTGSPCPAADPAAASGGSGAPDPSGKVEDL